MKIHHTLANKLGYDLIRHKKSHLELKDHLPKILKGYEVDTVIDVGANIGQFLEMVKSSGFEGKTFSFEPIPKHADGIKEKYKNDPQVKVYNLALGESESVLKLNVFKSSVFSSFKQPTDFSKSNYKEHVSEYETIEVPIKRLDEILMAELKDSKKIMLKVDTQGFDLEVVKGATKILDRVVAINFECSVIPIYENTPNYLETLTFFHQLGFVPSGFFPVSRVDNTHELIEFDVIMVKKS